MEMEESSRDETQESLPHVYNYEQSKWINRFHFKELLLAWHGIRASPFLVSSCSCNSLSLCSAYFVELTPLPCSWGLKPPSIHYHMRFLFPLNSQPSDPPLAPWYLIESCSVVSHWTILQYAQWYRWNLGNIVVS